MSRPDQSIAFLRSYGFSVFRFPRASAQPLELSILGSFIGALGGGKLGLDGAFNKARTITFQYAAVMEVKVDVPIIQQAVGGNLKVDSAGTRESRVAFEGAVPVFLEARGAFVRVAQWEER